MTTKTPASAKSPTTLAAYCKQRRIDPKVARQRLRRHNLKPHKTHGWVVTPEVAKALRG